MIAAHGNRLVTSDGASVKLYDADTPQRKHRLDAPVVAVARARSRAGALDARGTLHLFDDAGAVVASKPLSTTPRSLYAHDDRFFALDASGFTICDRGGATLQRIDGPPSRVMAIDPDGTLVIVGDNCSITEWTGTELVDIPPSIEQIRAIAPLGSRKFVCLGKPNWFLLDLAHRELESIAKRVSSPPLVVASPSTRRHAWWSIKRTVVVGEIAGTELVPQHHVKYEKTYGRTREVLGFSAFEANDVPLSITGLAFLDETRLAIALDTGLGNIIELGAEPAKAARKLDEHEGEAHSSWRFELDGQQLIAP
jgi:hypothetical protein